MTFHDEIIDQVERVRDLIARRYDYDMDRIFAAAKERSLRDRKLVEKPTERAAGVDRRWETEVADD